jgi:hypothetical protein
MKKSSWVAFCLASLLVSQVVASAASTNAVYSVSINSAFKAGNIRASQSNTGTATFFSDGTANLTILGYTVSGAYAVAKNGRSVTLTDNTDKSVIASNLAAYIESQAPGVTITVKSSKFSKITIGKDGVPVKATDTVTGKGSLTFDGKTRSRGFTLKSLVTSWKLLSGTNL